MAELIMRKCIQAKIIPLSFSSFLHSSLDWLSFKRISWGKQTRSHRKKKKKEPEFKKLSV